MEKRRKAQKRFSALTSFLLALALLAGTLGALPAECFAAQPEKAAFHSTYGFRLGSSAKMELQFRDKLEKNYKVNGNTYYGSQILRQPNRSEPPTAGPDGKAQRPGGAALGHRSAGADRQE